MSSDNYSRYLIIGAGIAGMTAATGVRSGDLDSSITLINGEAYPPYKRTNLSKFLASGFTEDDFTLITGDDLSKFYGVQLLQDYITGIDYSGQIAFGRNASYRYDYLILATGSCYELPTGLRNPKVLYYHNKAETFNLQEQLCEKQNIAVLGAGVQGIETCYELLKLGKQVSLIDPNDRPLARFHSAYISKYLREDLARNNVQCHWQQRIQEFSGSILEEFELVICCFGTRAVMDLFPTNAQLQPSLQIAVNVFACGDNVSYDVQSNSRCTLWHEAMDLGQLAGRNAALLGTGRVTDLGESAYHYQRKTYRTKIEVAERILFLAAPPQIRVQRTTTQRQFLQQGDYYQFFFNEAETLQGASLLTQDRDLLQTLQQAIWEHWHISQLLEEFAIDAANEF